VSGGKIVEIAVLVFALIVGVKMGQKIVKHT
jgi:hypothetical protein